MPGATRSILINAPMEKVFSVVTDYEKYPQFLSEVKKVRVLRREGLVEVDFEVDLVKTIKYTLRMKEEKPSKMNWTFVKGDFMKDNRGGWLLEQVGDAVKATYNIEVTVGALVPKTIVNALVDTSLPKTLEAFKKRSEAK